MPSVSGVLLFQGLENVEKVSKASSPRRLPLHTFRSWETTMAKGWTDAELAASVDAYKAMLAKEAKGESYNKAQIYRDLAEKFGRSAGAFERRMQNLSTMYNELGEKWVPGLAPLPNVGAGVKRRLLPLITGNPPVDTKQYKYGEKRTWELVLDAVAAHGGNATRAQVRTWILAQHPSYDPQNLVDLEVLSVNSDSRTSYSPNSKPRLTNTGNEFDRLYKHNNQRPVTFEQYAVAVHGIWEIYSDPTSGNRYKMSVQQVADPVTAGLAIAKEEAEGGDAFDPANTEDARKRVFAEIYRRQGQPKFRKSLLKAYNGACAITACRIEQILEAAHVYPYKGEHTNAVSNGLLLRTDIHTLFDLYLITIDSKTLTVMVSPELLGTEFEALHGKPLARPNRKDEQVSLAALDDHRSYCVWAN